MYSDKTIKWDKLQKIDNSEYYFCPICHGKRMAYMPELNKYKTVVCANCSGFGIIKKCSNPDCYYPVLPINKTCDRCLLRLDETEPD